VDAVVPERLQPVLEEVRPLAERFGAAGKRAYLVGGSVRDLLLGRDAAEIDFDLTTDARPDDIEAIVRPWADAVWLQGKRFGTIGCRKGGRDYEITTHRAEAYAPDSRKPDVVFGDDIETDLSRRDFTVNAMALSLPDPELIDPFGGVVDLAAKRLRTPLAPDESFNDDPLRMLRAARFVAGYGLVPDDALVDAVKRLHDRLEIVAAERIRMELDKLMVVERPGAGLWFLVETGLAEEFLPELPGLALEQDPIHRHKDVLTHTLAVVDKTSPDEVVRLAALFHDIGKPRTRSFEHGGVTFRHHEAVGARITRKRLEGLGYADMIVEDVSEIVRLSGRFKGYADGWSDSAVRRYARDAGRLLGALNELVRCDCTTRNRAKEAGLQRDIDDLERRIKRLADEDRRAAERPGLDGTEVMAHLGLAPGRDVGAALAFLLVLKRREGDLPRDELLTRLDAWWAERRSEG
jgi:poly(A) polymerase